MDWMCDRKGEAGNTGRNYMKKKYYNRSPEECRRSEVGETGSRS
jgi:hypothetical protein